MLLVAIALSASTAERITGYGEPMPPLSPWSLAAMALGTVFGGLILRRRLLFLANRKLLRDPQDANGLIEWRRATIQSMVLAMSIGVYGLFVRMMGHARIIEWLFFFASVALVFLWGPHLDNGTSSPANTFSNQQDVKS
jgi:hypothetical protein